VRRRLLVLVVAAASLAACDGGGGGEETVTVVASFYPLAEAAERIGGHDVEVVNLTPAGTEPHDLELTPDQVDAIEDADVVLYLGGGFQPAVEEVAGRRRAGSIDLLDVLPLEEGDDNGPDAHFWLDPTLLAEAVGPVQRALGDAEPVARSEFEAHADDYRAELERLDEEFQTALARCARRDIVTSHAAFSYLARRYDLVQVPISGLSPEAEPNPERLAELTDLIRARGVTTVFYEALVSPDVAETLAREAGVDTAVLDPIEGLSEEDAEGDGDYAAVMRRNLAALREALGCG
jgi:zinc transport system substrate-binding protein